MKKKYGKEGIAFIVIAWLSVFTIVGQNIGEIAPDFTLKSTDNVEFKLSEQKGKVVFIFLVGYSCPYCINNAPYIESAIYQKYKDDADFVAVAIDLWDGDEAAAQSFIPKSGINYPLLMQGSTVGTAFDITYDRLLVIDKEGILRYKGSQVAGDEEADAAEIVIANYISSESTSLSKLEKQMLNVFPNPTKNLIFVETALLSNKKVEYTVYNSLGQVIIRNELKAASTSLKINVSDLINGVYFVQLASEGKLESARFVVGNK